MAELLFSDEGWSMAAQQPRDAGNIDLILMVGDDDQWASGGWQGLDV